MLVLEDVSRDQLFVYYVFGQLIAGLIYRYLPSPNLKCNFGTLVGILLLVVITDTNIIHILTVTVVSGLLLTQLNRNKYLVVIVAIFNMAYLLFYWRKERYGFSSNPHGSTAVAQALASVKLIGLAVELSDTTELESRIERLSATTQRSKVQEEELRAAELEYEYRNVKPTFMGIFHYSFCFLGQMAAVFKYRTFVDMLQAPYAFQTKSWKLILHRLKFLIFTGPAYVILKTVNDGFPMNDSIRDIPELWVRLWKPILSLLYFRATIYFAITFFECTFIMAHCGVYPKKSNAKPGHGPKDFVALVPREMGENQEFSWETVRSYNEFEVEFTPTLRQGVRNWNMTIQYWIFRVYCKIPNRFWGSIIVLTMAAFFHGWNFGYYASMLSLPFALVVENKFAEAFKRYGPQTFSCVQFVIKHTVMEYLWVPFLMSTFHNTMIFYISTYFLGHVILIILLVVSTIWLHFYPPKSRISQLT